MSFSDNLENNLKNMESREEHGPAESPRIQKLKATQRAGVLASAPNADKLRSGKFTAGLLSSATRIAHGLRTKVNIFWLGTTLRLQAREHRLELRPSPEGVTAYFFVNGGEVRREKVDLNEDPERLARQWLDMVGPRPAPEPLPDFDVEEPE